MGDAARDMESRLPPVFDPDDVYLRYPTDYNECLNTTLVQEVTKFTRLERVMVSTLASLQLALKGLVVLSSELEAMGNAVYDGKVPIPWSSKGYPSLKPLPLWYADLLRRLDFMEGWIQKGTPDVIWISVFFFPQGCARGVLASRDHRSWRRSAEVLSSTSQCTAICGRQVLGIAT